MTVMTVLGARPQFIKAAPVCFALKDAGVDETIIHTGQHYDDVMSKTFFDEMSIPNPKYNLKVGSGSHAQQTARIMESLEEVFANHRPKAIIVYGDTNTTLSASITACKMGIPIYHVEAGLRSYNKSMPEEHNRILTDHCSDFLFCPTETARQNLKLENLINNVHLVGDTMLDATKMFTTIAANKSEIINKLFLNNEHFILATVHRPYNTDDAGTLQKIIDALSKIDEKVILPVHPRLRNKLDEFNIIFPKNIHPTEPLGYLDTLILERNARVIVTDSGGLQKEAYFQSTPCVTLRPETEWTETLESDWNRLAWNSEEEIVSAVEKSLNSHPTSQPPHFGDGKAANKIAEIIKKSMM